MVSSKRFGEGWGKESLALAVAGSGRVLGRSWQLCGRLRDRRREELSKLLWYVRSQRSDAPEQRGGSSRVDKLQPPPTNTRGHPGVRSEDHDGGLWLLGPGAAHLCSSVPAAASAGPGLQVYPTWGRGSGELLLQGLPLPPGGGQT